MICGNPCITTVTDTDETVKINKYQHSGDFIAQYVHIEKLL